MANYVASADLNKDGKIGPKELKKWNKAGRPVDDLDVERFATQFGYAGAVLKKFPELQEILERILTEGITDPNSQLAEIQNSEWFRSYLPSYIEMEKARQSMAPEIWDARMANTAEDIMRKFSAAGATIDEATARKYAEQMAYGSSGDVRDGDWQEFDQDWLDQTLADAIDFTKTKTVNGVEFFDLTGKAEETATSLYEAAYQYGMDTSMSNESFTSWFRNAMDGIMSGKQAIEDVDDELINSAMSMFPGMQQNLLRGQTLRQAADPYLTAIGGVLEMDPGSIDLNDGLVQKILNNVGSDGQFKPMSLYDAKLAARRDDRWQYTGTAKKEYTDMASMILRDFGFLG